MIARLTYRTGHDSDGNEVLEVEDCTLRHGDDPKDESEKLVQSFIDNGPPDEIWFAFEHIDDAENIREVKEEFWELIRSHVGRKKFPKKLRERLVEIRMALENDRREKETH